jgi:trans-2,3-dihydro-3-hydroxyanthranilate isomerase
MASHRFRLLNVFAESALSGNPLAVFEDGALLSDEQMQALALQFNLSETTFLFPSSSATAKVRIFTPTFEMPFAGHPTLGTAQVARALFGCGDELTLEMRAGVIPVTATGNRWTLRANAPKTRPPTASDAELAAMLGLDETDLGDTPLWVDTGSEQLVIRLVDPEAVRRARPDASALARHASNASRSGLVYVWAHADVPPVDGEEQVVARFFFLKGGAVTEDPGTGSACANLGGWLLATRHEQPLAITIDQGELTGRRCKLSLRVDASGAIFVGGQVVEIGHGEISF